MSALCGEGMLVCVHSFVHNFVRSDSGVEFVLNGFDLAVWFRVVFAVKSVLNGFDLASRIKSGNPHSPKNHLSSF